VDFTGGGIYQVEVNAAGNSDLIDATGTATLTSGTVQVIPEAGLYAPSTDYTILTAAGGLGGTTFSGVSSNFAFFVPTLFYDATNVFLNLKVDLNNLATVTNLTENQTSVFNTLSTLYTTNPAGLQELFSNLLFLDIDSAQSALDSLGGVQHTHAQGLMLGHHQQFLQLLFNRTGFNPNTQFAFQPMQDPMTAYTTGMNAGDTLPQGRGWWLQGLGRFGEFDDTSNATGADYHSAGVAFGIDTKWRDWVVGLAGNYLRSDANTFGGDLEVDSFQGAVYAGREFNDGIYMNAAVGVGYHDTDAERTVSVGTLSGQASADYDALTAGVGVEVGRAFELTPQTTLTPYAGIEYTHTNREGFTESGAGVMNLSVNDEDHNSLRTTLGFRVSEEITTGSNMRIKPYAYVAYVREHLDTEATMEAGFSGVPSSTFRIEGTDLDRDRAQVGAGISGQVNERLSFNLGYTGEIAGSDDHHGFSATVGYTW
jgi:outer membrane autotransporter protein